MEKETTILDLITSPSADSAGRPLVQEIKEPEEEKHPEVFKVVSGEKRYSDKYKKKLVEKASKNPKSVMVKTPEGEMTMDEAIKKGFDPKTGEFTRKPPQAPRIEDHFKGKSPEQIAKLKQMMDPRSLDMSPEEMERLGMTGAADAGKYNPNVSAPRPDQEQGPADPIAALLGGKQ